jgi:uncharacterized membrane protein YeaQ/YmgE (transglycosylase-associated protein family)
MPVRAETVPDMSQGLTLGHVGFRLVRGSDPASAGATLRPAVLITIIGTIAAGFIVGALARLAVPGPDPMPAWLTVLIGLIGSGIGSAIAYGLFGRDAYAGSMLGFLAAVLLVVAYRHYVQHRPIWGRDALRFPRRGVGIQEYRKRLERIGIDPDRLPFETGYERPSMTAPSAQPEPSAASGAEPSPEERTEALRRLAEDRDAGLISAEDYRERRRRIVYGED